MTKVEATIEYFYFWTCPACSEDSTTGMGDDDFDEDGESVQTCEGCEEEFTVTKPDDED